MKKILSFMISLLFALQGYAQKMTVKDSDAHILMEVNDEGTVGSITVLPSGSAPSTPANKLYNVDGSLYWNGSALGMAGSAGGWTDGGANVYTTTSTDKVGIGTSSPEFKLSLDNDGGILAKGTSGDGTVLSTSGFGTRLIWYPRKAAFRAGYVGGDQWDDANIGDASVAINISTTASGNYSTAMGGLTTAIGDYSTAMGNSASASGTPSTAMGGSTTASGNYSTAMGNSTIASGFSSTAMGNSTIASGHASTAMGDNTTASGVRSTAMGQYTTAGSYVSVAIGRSNIGDGATDSWVSTDPIFEIGIGADYEGGLKANAVTVLKNGKVGIGTATPNALFTVQNTVTTDWNEMVDIIAPDAANGVHTSGIIFGRHCSRNESGNLYFIPSATDKKGRISFSIWDFNDLVTIEGTGNVGIGDPTPDYLLDMEADGVGGYYSASDHQWHNGSSRKLKQDIEPNKLDVLGILNDVKVVQYRFKSEAAENPNASLHVGFIAEDAPELLTGKDRNSMSTGDCIGLLLAVVKEQQKEIEKLKAEIEK